MQIVGVILVAVGIWVAYCGAKGIAPGPTAVAVIRDPANAGTLIADAAAKANEPYTGLFAAAASASAAVGSSLGGAGNALGIKGLNPWLAFPVSDDWAAHLRRGSQGGTDYVMPVGTPVVTPLAGTVQNSPNAGAAGNKCTVTFEDGWKMVVMHLSRFAKSNGDKVGAFSIIGYSGGAKGAAGSGSSTGAHLHVMMFSPAGVPTPFETYIAGKSAPASTAGSGTKSRAVE